MAWEANALIAAIVLGIVHIVAASHGASLQRGYRWAASPRDAPVPPLTGVPGRLQRAAGNFAETFPFFAAAVLLAGQQGISNALTITGAYSYLAARIVYFVLYATGTFLWRSMAWNVATLGILAILWGLMRP